MISTMACPPTRRAFFRGICAPLLLRQGLAGYAPLPIFLDATSRSGIGFMNEASPTSQKYLPETMTGGVAMLDYDNDGWLDLFFVNGAALSDPMPPGAKPDKSNPKFWNRLYRNNRCLLYTSPSPRD